MGRWTSNKALGHALILGKDRRKEDEQDWMMCAHCSFGWKVEPGSGRRRGWCNQCAGPLCNRGKWCWKPCAFMEKMKHYGRGVDFNKAFLICR